jgi:ketosteroid isomerase-like protein
VNKADFADYLQRFGAGDYPGFARYYADDVVLELPGQVLRGRQAIVDFYRSMNRSVRESLAVNQLIADEDGIAADLSMQFRAHEDAPDFSVAPMRKGEVIRGRVFVLYTLQAGRIAHIRVARAAPLEGPMPA